ncbi:MAG: hypothetical protein WAU88_06240 [Candidatus Zixiibacteriota bacterium]
MEEASSQSQQSEATKVVKTKSSKNIVSYIVVAVLLAVGVGAYYWRDKKASQDKKEASDKISQLQAQVESLGKELETAQESAKSSDSTSTSDTTTTTETETKTTKSAVPTAAVKENVIASITSDNTAALEGYMASSVHVVYAASEGVFDHTPAQAVADLNYLSSAVDPWDFELSAATLADYATGDYKDYFESNSIVGKSSDGMVVVFNFNDAGKVNAVFMCVSSDLL